MVGAPIPTTAGSRRSSANGPIPQPGGEAIHDALYKAYFVEASNIGDPDLLVDIAASVGLPADEARAVLTSAASRTRSTPIGRSRIAMA